MARGLRHCVGEDTPALKIIPADLLVVATSMLHGVAVAITRQLDMVDDLARMHANLQHDRAEFADSVRNDLEGI